MSPGSVSGWRSSEERNSSVSAPLLEEKKQLSTLLKRTISLGRRPMTFSLSLSVRARGEEGGGGCLSFLWSNLVSAQIRRDSCHDASAAGWMLCWVNDASWFGSPAALRSADAAEFNLRRLAEF